MAELSELLTIIGVLVALTNIITQVLKKATWGKLPTNILVLVISEALTMAAFFGCCSWKGVVPAWYMAAGAFVAGFLVSYAAMFGFDKLKEALTQLGGWPT